MRIWALAPGISTVRLRVTVGMGEGTLFGIGVCVVVAWRANLGLCLTKHACGAVKDAKRENGGCAELRLEPGHLFTISLLPCAQSGRNGLPCGQDNSRSAGAQPRGPGN